MPARTQSEAASGSRRAPGVLGRATTGRQQYHLISTRFCLSSSWAIQLNLSIMVLIITTLLTGCSQSVAPVTAAPIPTIAPLTSTTAPSPRTMPSSIPTVEPTPTSTQAVLLLGKWKRATPRNLTIPISAILPDAVELLENNIWIASSLMHGTYSLVPGDRIQFDGLPISPILSYSIVADTLKFRDENYDEVVYTRINDVRRD